MLIILTLLKEGIPQPLIIRIERKVSLTKEIKIKVLVTIIRNIFHSQKRRPQMKMLREEIQPIIIERPHLDRIFQLPMLICKKHLKPNHPCSFLNIA